MSLNNVWRTALAVCVTATLTTQTLAAVTPLSCPATITTQQSGAPAEGWDVSEAVTNQKHVLRAAGFFDGPPKDQAQLKPRVQPSKAGNKTIYTFEGPAPDGIWLSCGYDGTRVVASKKIPSGITRCTVAYGAETRVHPAPAIKSIVCK